MRSLATACYFSLAIISANLTLGCSSQVGIGGKSNEAGSGAEGAETGGGAAVEEAAGGESSGGSGAVESTGGSGAAAGAGATSSGGSGATEAVEDMQCQPGLYYHCPGDDYCYGQQLCLESGEQLGACVCFGDAQPVADVWDDEAGHNIEGPEVPIMVPYNDRFPSDHCPTRPDLVEGTVCQPDTHCSYGGCWWVCDCYDTGWYCDVLLC